MFMNNRVSRGFGGALLAGLLCFAPGARAEKSQTARETLLREYPAAASDPRLARLAEEVLRELTAAQVSSFLRGTDTSAIVLADGRSLEDFLAGRGSGYEVPRFTMDGGGGSSGSPGGTFRLSGTLGQPDAARSAGGAFTLQGGFWAASTSPPSQPIFADGFESGDLNAWNG